MICPGGGYWNLAWDKEGEEVAARFNTLGVTGVVLKYRVPRRPGEPERLPAPGPLLDAQRAIRLVRSRAGEWGIDPERIGIMGFSAGGHLAVMTAISFEKPSYEPIDDVDRASCRPDFAVVAYPGYILTQPGSDALADYIRIPKGTGPMFLVHASDDDERGAKPEQSLALYRALRDAGVPVELHIYDEGGHGFGVQEVPNGRSRAGRSGARIGCGIGASCRPNAEAGPHLPATTRPRRGSRPGEAITAKPGHGPRSGGAPPRRCREGRPLGPPGTPEPGFSPHQPGRLKIQTPARSRHPTEGGPHMPRERTSSRWILIAALLCIRPLGACRRA